MSNKNRRVISLKKFSNINIFEKREKNNSEIRITKNLYPSKLNNYRHKDDIRNKSDLEISQILFSFYSFQNEDKLNHKSFSKKFKNNMTTTSIFNKTSSNFSDTAFPFYLTQTEPNKINIKKSFKNYSHSRNNNLISFKKKRYYNSNINKNNNELIFGNYYNKTFSNFEFKRNKEKEREKNKDDCLMATKLKKMKVGYMYNIYNTKDYIDKFREFLIIKKTSETKSERNKRTEEIHNNQLEIIDDKYKTLEHVKSLYNQYFSYKFGEYVRFIFRKREEEQNIDSTLLKKIYALKKEISQLMNKIRKVELEKYNISQWLFFLIRLKEKKLKLPKYYTNILEINIKRNNYQRRTARADITNLNKISRKNRSNITIHENFKYSKNFENNTSVPQDEVIRILRYKNKLVFENPEDFHEELKDLENENINLFNKCDLLNSEIRKLKEEYSKLKNKKLNEESIIEGKIREKEIVLEEFKKKHKNLLKIITYYNNTKKQETKKQINNLKDMKYRDEIKLSLNSKKKKLYSTVEQLFLVCQNIKIKKNNFSKENQNNNFYIKKDNGNKEEEILQMLEFIEIKICQLLNIFSIYKNPHNPNYELIRKLKNNLLRKRKIEKAELVRIEKENNYMKFIKKVNNRYNKLFFLERRRIGFHNFGGWANEFAKNKNTKESLNYIPTFNDFIFESNNDEIYNLTSNYSTKTHFRSKS